MFKALCQTLSRFRANQSGVTLVEYGLAVAVAVGLGAAAFSPLIGDITDSMLAAGAPMPNP